MKFIHRNVILDLLPAYVAGEASKESRALVEEYAQNDPQITEIISTGKLDFAETSPEIFPPDDLEMKTMKRLRRSIRRRMGIVAIMTASILMAPLIAMLFTGEVNWSIFDFLIMGMLLLGAGLAYVLISEISENFAYRTAVALAVLTGFLLIWINLAVGIIGSENNPANQLYIAVLAVGFIGAGVARLKPRGMARTMFSAAFVQLLVPVIAWIIWRPALDDISGIAGVVILNAIFTGMFAVSGLMFKRAGAADSS